MDIINYFELKDNNGNYLMQSQVDFVNVFLGVDNPFFLDFNNIISSETEWANRMKKTLESFSFNLGSMLLTNKRELKGFLNNIHESNATYLGWSKGRADGNSIGPILCKSLIDSLDDYKSLYISGKFSFNTMQFTTKQIGIDRISDFITSVCKLDLINYTISECDKYGIERTKSYRMLYYDLHTSKWCYQFFTLPTFEGNPVIFIPKDLISSAGSYKCTFTKFMTLGLNSLVDIYAGFIDLKSSNKNLKISKKLMKHYFYQKGYDDKDIVRLIFKELPQLLLDKILNDINSSNYSLSDDEIENIISIRFRESA